MAEKICIWVAENPQKAGSSDPATTNLSGLPLRMAVGGLENLVVIVEKHLGHPLDSRPNG